ncbi:MAG: protein-L-isoaspartate(D-aspartate) O-methyltransferase [bacterium]
MRISLWMFTALFAWFLLSDEKAKHEQNRSKMLETLRQYKITDERVLNAMDEVPRHLFVPKNLRHRAYGNHALPIGEGQTISQPYIVALMTQELKPDSNFRVLEIGTGSGYQAAVLSVLIDSVFTIEIKTRLAELASKRLQKLGYENVVTRCADGYFGWPEKAPFDAIIITCAVNHVPQPLLDQLKVGGHLILPLGSTLYYQTLVCVTKKENDVEVEYLGTVAFVPMTGKAEKT